MMLESIALCESVASVKASSSGTVHWADLEEDALRAIFRRLPGVPGQLGHLLVCRRWHLIGCAELPSFRLLPSSRTCLSPHAFCVFPNLRVVELPANSLAWTSDLLLRNIAANCPLLTRLVVGHQAGTVAFTAYGIRAVFTGCLKLEEFTFECLNRSPMEMPEEIGQAKHLTKLHLGVWETGSFDDSNLQHLPATLGQLERLQELTVASTRLRSLPAAAFGPGSPLRELYLRSVDLEALPPSVTALASLETLALKCPMLSHLPEAVTRLSALTRISLADCLSLRLPPTFGHLPRLRQLRLHNCISLHRLPGSVAQLQRLQELRVSSCISLLSLPDELTSLPALKTLHLDLADLFFTLPEDLGSLPALETFFLSAPSMQFLPQSLGHLSRLTRLQLQGCLRLFCLPSTFPLLRALRSLHLDNCPRLQALPAAEGELLALEEVAVSHCPQLWLPAHLQRLVPAAPL